MSLQSKYRKERDGIFTFENDEYYFAYKISDSKTECHVKEVFIRDDLRGNSKQYYDEIFYHIKSIEGIKYIVGFIYPSVLGSELSLVSLVKFGFKIHSVDNEKIILILEV